MTKMESPSVYDSKSKSNKQIFVEPNCAVDLEVGRSYLK